MNKYIAKYPITNKTEQDREFRKAYYITDPKKRLERFREVVKMDSGLVRKNGVVRKNAGKDIEWESKLTVALKDSEQSVIVKKLLESSFQFGGNVYERAKRRLEVEIYTDNIIKQADNKRTDTEKIDFLIDKQFEFHHNVFDSELENIAFKEEVEWYIIDELQEKINAISNKDYEFSEGDLKPLEWTLNDNILGTLFACLLNKGLIAGKKQDVIKFLTSAFPGINKDSLTDTFLFKEGKYQKDTRKETEQYMNSLGELTEKYVDALPKKRRKEKA